jgi:hypothetical protein
MLTGALMLASLGLMPGLSIAMFGVEVLIIGLILVVTLDNQLKSFQPVGVLTRFKCHWTLVVDSIGRLLAY